MGLLTIGAKLQIKLGWSFRCIYSNGGWDLSMQQKKWSVKIHVNLVTSSCIFVTSSLTRIFFVSSSSHKDTMVISGKCQSKKSISEANGRSVQEDNTVDDNESIVEEIHVHADEKQNKKRDDNTDDSVGAEVSLTDTQIHFKDASEYLKKFLELTQKGHKFKEEISLTDFVESNGNVVTFLEGETILRSGEESCGIFVIVTGTVNVLTADRSMCIIQLSTGDVFGDISTIFGLKCTATIKAKTDVITVLIKPEVVYELFENYAVDLDLIDWCIKSRYLPTGKEVDVQRTYRRMALQFLSLVPLFQSWSLDDLKNLIISFDRGILTVYPPHSTLVSVDDPVTSLYLVIRGTLKVEGDGNFIRMVTVSRYDKPFIYGHFCTTDDEQMSALTIRAITNSQVIVVDRDWILSVVNGDPDKAITHGSKIKRLTFFNQRLAHYSKQFGAKLNYDLLYYHIGNCELYKGINCADLESKLLTAVFEEFKAGDTVILGVEMATYESVAVISGKIIQTKAKQANKISKSDERQTETPAVDTKENTHEIQGTSETGEDSISTEQDKMSKSEALILEDNGEQEVFEEGAVIDLAILDTGMFILKSETRCLVGKIKKGNQTAKEQSDDRNNGDPETKGHEENITQPPEGDALQFV